jgi:hypothetical protein
MQAINEQQSQEICKHVFCYNPYQYWRKPLLRLTYPIWKPLFNHILWELYHREVIDSSRLHIATSLTDRTQKHKMW